METIGTCMILKTFKRIVYTPSWNSTCCYHHHSLAILNKAVRKCKFLGNSRGSKLNQLLLVLLSFTHTYINFKPARSLSVNKTEVDSKNSLTQADSATHIGFESKCVTIWVQGRFASPASGALRVPLFHQQMTDEQKQRGDVKRKKRRVASVLSFCVFTRDVSSCLKF